MSQKHGYWYLLSGLILGLGLGLLAAWVLFPVQFTDTTPASLRTDFKDDYRLMIASAYAANPDLPRARARLGLLQDADPVRALGETSQRLLEGAIPKDEVQKLADLSTILQTEPTSTPTAEFSPTPPASMTPLPSPTVPTETPAPLTATPTTTPSQTPSPSAAPTSEESPTPSPDPLSTIAVRPSQTPTPTPGAPYRLAKQTTFCESDLPGLLQINITGAEGKPAAGIELVITWVNGEEHFFTGLKPEMGFGYADYSMTPNIEYALSVAGGARITGLSASKCSGGYPGGIRMEFKKP